MASTGSTCCNRSLLQESTLAKTPILLVDMVRIVREMVEAALETQTDLAVVAAIPDPSGVPQAVTESRPELVVIGAPGPELATQCSALVRQFPELVAVGVDSASGDVQVHQEGRQVKTVRDLSPADLVQVIREALATRRD